MGEWAEGGRGWIQTRSKNEHLISEEIKSIHRSPGTTGIKVGVNLGGNETVCTRELERLVLLIPKPSHYCCPRVEPPGPRATVEKQVGSPKQGSLFNTRQKTGAEAVPAHSTHIPFFFAFARPTTPLLGMVCLQVEPSGFVPEAQFCIGEENQHGREV